MEWTLSGMYAHSSIFLCLTTSSARSVFLPASAAEGLLGPIRCQDPLRILKVCMNRLYVDLPIFRHLARCPFLPYHHAPATRPSRLTFLPHPPPPLFAASSIVEYRESHPPIMAPPSQQGLLKPHEKW